MIHNFAATFLLSCNCVHQSKRIKMFEKSQEKLDTYKERVVTALDYKIKVDGFKNPDVAHTIIIDEEFIKRAKFRICILCNQLGQDVWCSEGVLKALRIAKENGVHIDVITRDSIDGKEEGNAFFKILNTFPQDKFSYKISNDTSKVSANILVIDKLHYRVEPTPILNGKPNRKAFVGIHCPKTAFAWEKEFDKLCS